MVMGAGPSKSGSLRINQLWTQEEVKEYVSPLSMIALFKMEIEIMYRPIERR